MESYSLIDDLGILHHFDKIPQRIVSLVPSQTELIVDLGLESKLVGITKFCVHPADLRKKKTIVGGTKKVDFDTIKKLLPDLIICNKEENTSEIVKNLRKVCKVWVTDIFTIEDNFKMIDDFGKILGCTPQAQELNLRLKKEVRDFVFFIKSNSIKKVVYFIWKNPIMVAGSHNFIDTLLQLNRFENVFASQSRYPEINFSAINEKIDLEYIFLSSEPYPFKEKDRLELAEIFPLTKVVLVDGEMFSWYGSRLLKAISYFKELQQKL